VGRKILVEFEEHPARTKVIVRYNPAKPEESVLYGKGEVRQPGDNLNHNSRNEQDRHARIRAI
jgi:hypothetical protein